ncbi:MAG TPA: S8 family serine peptidase [Burkholderiaceae bacterium]|nr:S8 family serine peptidase [Burkholderiaceae bacterium]
MPKNNGLKLAVGVCAAVMATSAAAQVETTYVLMASKWGQAQANAVTAAGGTVRFSHNASGLAVAKSTNPDFLKAALAGGAIADGTVDFALNLALPVRTADLTADAVNPDDDRFFKGIQWAPQAVKAPAAWAKGYTGKGVRVAVIDGGNFNTHPDLAANVDSAAGRSFVEGAPGSCEVQFNCDTGTFWHGTHVAGIIAALDNTIGVVGIAPDATIVPVKVLHNGSGSFAAVIQGIIYSAMPVSQGGGGAHIINMSLGADFPRGGREAASLTSGLNRAVNFAASQGVLVLSAAGNDGYDLDHTGNLITTPAQSGNGLAVSATGPFGFAYGNRDFTRFASYSNYGNSLVTVAGPGGDFAWPTNEFCTLPTYSPAGTVTIPCWAFDMVLSTSRAGYSWAAGTSMATPAAAAVAALIKQKYPNISVGAWKNRLANSSVDTGKRGHDPYYGRGFINAEAAVAD